MSDILFFSDLDNTLLYSYRHSRPGDVCVELHKGKQQGFMAQDAIAALRNLPENVILIPVTTRSIEQYARIQWPAVSPPVYAIVCNGATLLENGIPSPEWQNESENLIAPHRIELERMSRLLSEKHRFFIRCRLVGDAYLFVYTRDYVNVNVCADNIRRETSLNVIASGRKIYLFPPCLDKGSAVSRFKRHHPTLAVFAAGDSVIDTPMLQLADVAMAPNAWICRDIPPERRRTLPDTTRNFGEFVLETVGELAREYGAGC